MTLQTRQDRRSAIDDQSLFCGERIDSVEKHLTFDRTLFSNINTIEFLRVWNEVENDRSRIHAEIAASKTIPLHQSHFYAEFPSNGEDELQRNQTTYTVVMSTGMENRSPQSSGRTDPHHSSQVPEIEEYASIENVKDNTQGLFDIELGLGETGTAGKGFEDLNKSDIKRYKEIYKRNQILKYCALGAMFILAPMGIICGVQRSKKQSGILESNGSGLDIQTANSTAFPLHQMSNTLNPTIDTPSR
jgi:hypothetical protein